MIISGKNFSTDWWLPLVQEMLYTVNSAHEMNTEFQGSAEVTLEIKVKSFRALGTDVTLNLKLRSSRAALSSLWRSRYRVSGLY